VALAGVAPCAAQNVLGIDFGSEWIKLAVVQRSAGVQIVLNEASKRKSPNAVAFNPEDRSFGDTAMVKPHLAFTHTRELLGKQYSDTLKNAYGPQYFPYELVVDEDRGAIKIKEGERFLAPETLAAMVMTYAKSLAQTHTGEKVSDCVITVPGFYRQFERQAVLDAAHIAGLKVLSLMNDHTAVALKYGIDHNVAALTEPENVLFYDMGSTSTRVSVVQFSAIPDKEAFQKNKTLGQLKVLSTSWDETLGGAAFTQIVADMLEKQSKQPLAGNQRAYAKLLQTAEKTKMVLSANKEAHPSIESFIGDYDFKATVKRVDFEKAAEHLLKRTGVPIVTALALANLTGADIHKVEVVGGGWRIPLVCVCGCVCLCRCGVFAGSNIQMHAGRRPDPETHTNAHRSAIRS
jgi:hypoxia up-regulated 1